MGQGVVPTESLHINDIHIENKTEHMIIYIVRIRQSTHDVVSNMLESMKHCVAMGGAGWLLTTGGGACS